MSQLNILIIGSGGREHALAWALARSPHAGRIFVAPGNGGTAWPAASGRAESANVPIEDIEAIRTFAREQGIYLTVVGPEAPLQRGLVDVLGGRVFGPTRAAAQLEWSKTFAKEFMHEWNIPTGDYAAFYDFEVARAYITGLNGPCVVKADGLAAGKGVIVCDTPEAAIEAVRRILVEGEFGEAGKTVIVEERLTGPELSVLAFSDGRTFVPMPPARDHKRVFDGDQGPNTGGMGAYAPVPDVDADMLDEICRTVLQPAIDGMAARGTPYVGALYAGLMLTSGGPKVLEFNCRFGDPETQVILPLLKTDLLEVLLACVEGRLGQLRIEWQPGACATVVLAASGYPGAHPKDLPISGLEQVSDDCLVFHAGTARHADQIVTGGGRVLAVSARGNSLSEAVSSAYEGLKPIHFEGMHYRRDIGQKQSSAYAQAGVNIDAGNRATRLMGAAVKATYGPEVLAGIGAFGGLYDAAALKGMANPVLVASTDGVGTKTKVAARLNRWDTIGADLVNHCINDILVQGARPLFFLDYVASSRLDPEQIATIVGGVAEACRRAGCALLGGETAEMPGVYEAGEIDLAGTIVGLVERAQVIDGTRLRPGDAILGLPSNGLHTNGYSLARKVLDSLDWTAPLPEIGSTLGDALLAPHRAYLDDVRKLRAAGVDIRGLAHITGGGLIENPPRIFPAGLGALIRRGTWPEPPIFGLIQHLGQVDTMEMCRVFNMGLGMLVIVPPEHVAGAQTALPIHVVGEMVEGQVGVQIVDKTF